MIMPLTVRHQLEAEHLAWWNDTDQDDNPYADFTESERTYIDARLVERT